MDITGKKINFLGDSITEGAKVEDKSNIYHARLAKEYSLAAARNYGFAALILAFPYLFGQWQIPCRYIHS